MNVEITNSTLNVFYQILTNIRPLIQKRNSDKLINLDSAAQDQDWFKFRVFINNINERTSVTALINELIQIRGQVLKENILDVEKEIINTSELIQNSASCKCSPEKSEASLNISENNNCCIAGGNLTLTCDLEPILEKHNNLQTTVKQKHQQIKKWRNKSFIFYEKLKLLQRENSLLKSKEEKLGIHFQELKLLSESLETKNKQDKIDNSEKIALLTRDNLLLQDKNDKMEIYLVKLETEIKQLSQQNEDLQALNK